MGRCKYPPTFLKVRSKDSNSSKFALECTTSHSSKIGYKINFMNFYGADPFQGFIPHKSANHDNVIQFVTRLSGIPMWDIDKVIPCKLCRMYICAAEFTITEKPFTPGRNGRDFISIEILQENHYYRYHEELPTFVCNLKYDESIYSDILNLMYGTNADRKAAARIINTRKLWYDVDMWRRNFDKSRWISWRKNMNQQQVIKLFRKEWERHMEEYHDVYVHPWSGPTAGLAHELTPQYAAATALEPHTAAHSYAG